MINNPEQIRNVVVLGHQSAGKTSLVEAMHQIANNLAEKGAIEKKNTISDYLAEETKRLSSVSTSVISFEYLNHQINLLDIPGNDDFITEAISSIKMIKGAILVIDANSSVQVGTIRHYQMLKKRNIPTIIYVNKMDKSNADFELILEDIRQKLGKEAVPFAYPLGHENKFDGFVNIVELKARVFNGKECEDAEIYEDKKLKVFELHNTICEAVATTDEELLEKFFSDEPLTHEEILRGLRIGVLNGELTPVLVGSALKNIGIHTLLGMIIDYLPKPTDLKPFIVTNDRGDDEEVLTDVNVPFSAYCFKVTYDQFSGFLGYIKVNSGILKAGDDVYITPLNKKIKVTTLYRLNGKNRTPIEQAIAGDIVGVGRVDDLRNGMTLSDIKHIVTYSPIKLPTAIYYQALVVKNKDDENKLIKALEYLKIEDPSLDIKRNVETHQLLLGALSNTHIEYLLSRIKATYKIDVALEEVKVVYRESISKEATANGRYVKQSGGSGFYGIVDMRFEPYEGQAFDEQVVGGAVPKQYFPAVEKGFYEALEQGLLAGFPVINVKATLLDGKYHDVDSNELAFKMAAILAFKNAYPKCGPIILEPIIRMKVSVNSEFVGNVLSDLTSRRGRVLTFNEDEGGRQEIVALVPEAEILDYVSSLRSLTQGSGFFTRTFECYEQVPEYLKEKVIVQNSLLNK